MVAVREVGGDRLEQPRTLRVRSAEGGETGLDTSALQVFSLPTLVLPRTSPTVLHLEETLKDTRHDVLCPTTPP